MLSLSGALLYQYADNVSFLLLSAVGLIIIFGMMGVVNLAHGELMTLGAYITVLSCHAGVPLPFAIFLASLGMGGFGMILERLVVRRFYGNLLSSLVATWGISLVLSQGILIIMGPYLEGIRTPFGGFSFAGRLYSTYRLFLAAISVAVIVGIWWLFRHTKYGLRARATMENSDMAQSLGIDTSRIYCLTFGLGSALAGLAGGLYAPLAPIVPFFGAKFTPLAFITVVVGGGANVFTGILSSTLSLGGIMSGLGNYYGMFIARIGLLVTAIILIRILPTGISGYLEKRKAQKMRR